MRAKVIRPLDRILLAMLLSIGVAQTASAAALALKVETVEGRGSTIETAISTGRCEGLGILQFDLTYDPKIVEPEAVVAGPSCPNGLVESELLKPGVIGIALVSNAPLNGSGELIRVRFKRVGEGGRTELGITAGTAWDHEKNIEMQVTLEPGSLTLKPEGALSGMPGGIGMAIAIVIAAIIVLLVFSVLIIVKVGRAKKKNPRRSDRTQGKSPQTSCPKCGTRLDPGTQFCTSCGQAIAN